MSVRPSQPIPAPEEYRPEFDDLVLDPQRHRDDLSDATTAVELTLEMQHDVDTTGNRRHDETAPDVLTRQQSIGRVHAP
jgi:hypothetical protein